MRNAMGVIAQDKRSEIVEARAQLSSRTPATNSIPFWLYPQVLSLDAPAVAVAWQWLFAKSFGLAVTPRVLLLTVGCVWMIYAADHLLDVRAGLVYSARHRFIHRHQKSFWLVLAAVFAIGCGSALQLPHDILFGGLALSAIVGIYLAAVHIGGEITRRYFPKEFAIGAMFAAGSSIATWTTTGVMRAAWPSIALFAALCTLNCAAVDCWEWRSNRVLLRYPHSFTRWLGRHFFGVAVIIVFATLLFFFARGHAIPALLLSTLLLMMLAAGREFVPADAARLLADAALLTPVLFLLR